MIEQRFGWRRTVALVDGYFIFKKSISSGDALTFGYWLRAANRGPAMSMFENVGLSEMQADSPSNSGVFISRGEDKEQAISNFAGSPQGWLIGPAFKFGVRFSFCF